MKRYELYSGQIVRVVAPKIGDKLAKVVKVNPKMVRISLEDGIMWNVHPSFLTEASSSDRATWKSLTASSTPSKPLCLGTVVKFKNQSRESSKGLFVVVGSHGVTWRLARLGGDGGRYFRGIVSESIEAVEFDLDMEGV